MIEPSSTIKNSNKQSIELTKDIIGILVSLTKAKSKHKYTPDNSILADLGSKLKLDSFLIKKETTHPTTYLWVVYIAESLFGVWLLIVS